MEIVENTKIRPEEKKKLIREMILTFYTIIIDEANDKNSKIYGMLDQYIDIKTKDMHASDIQYIKNEYIKEMNILKGFLRERMKEIRSEYSLIGDRFKHRC